MVNQANFLGSAVNRDDDDDDDEDDDPQKVCLNRVKIGYRVV